MTSDVSGNLLQGRSQDFPEIRTIFHIPLPPPQKHKSCSDWKVRMLIATCSHKTYQTTYSTLLLAAH